MQHQGQIIFEVVANSPPDAASLSDVQRLKVFAKLSSENVNTRRIWELQIVKFVDHVFLAASVTQDNRMCPFDC